MINTESDSAQGLERVRDETLWGVRPPHAYDVEIKWFHLRDMIHNTGNYQFWLDPPEIHTVRCRVLLVRYQKGYEVDLVETQGLPAPLTPSGSLAFRKLVRAALERDYGLCVRLFSPELILERE